MTSSPPGNPSNSASPSFLGYSVTADELLRQLTGLATKDVQAQVERGADLVVRAKPAPDLFLPAAERTGVPLSRCLVIEASVVGIIQAAVAAGLPVSGLHGGGYRFEG